MSHTTQHVRDCAAALTAKPVNEGVYWIGANGNYWNDGTPQANAANQLNGSSGADLMQGLGSNGELAGGDGVDIIDGSSVDWVHCDSLNGGFIPAGVMVTAVFDYEAVKGKKYSHYVSQVAGGVTSYCGRLGSLDINGAGDQATNERHFRSAA